MPDHVSKPEAATVMDQAALRARLMAAFSKAELQTLCFDLGINYDNLPGDRVEDKARELLLDLHRGQRLPELLQLCRDRRPTLNWPSTVEFRQLDLSSGTPAYPRLVLIVGVILVIAVAVIGLLVWRASHPWINLTVQLYEVVDDSEGDLITAETFTNAYTGRSEGETLQGASRWIIEQVEHRYKIDSQSPVQVHVRVPVNLGQETITVESTLPDPIKMNAYIIVDGQKSRLAVNERDLGGIIDDIKSKISYFDLELSQTGYKPALIRVPLGQAVVQDLAMQPSLVAIGVREFDGDQNSVAVPLAGYLARDARLVVRDPARLKELQDEIARGKGLLANSPAAQQSVRTSLGVQVIVHGTYERQ